MHGQTGQVQLEVTKDRLAGVFKNGARLVLRRYAFIKQSTQTLVKFFVTVSKSSLKVVALLPEEIQSGPEHCKNLRDANRIIDSQS